jgi:hypothetical protein
MLNFRRLTFLFFSVTTVFLLLIGCINYVVDPYGLYRKVDLNGFNQQKEGVRSKIRFVKALELPLRKPKTIILGSSRVHEAINPDDIELSDQQYSPAYNLGIDMLRIHEAAEYLQFAVNNSDIKRVIFGLDFFMFNSIQQSEANFDPSLISARPSAFQYLKSTLISGSAFSDSMRTLKQSNSQTTRREFLSNGYRPAPMVFFGLSDYTALHYYTNYTFLSPTSNTKYYGEFSLNKKVFLDFEKILKICKERQIDLRMYISPAHADLEGEGIRATGNWILFESWKRKLVDLSDQYDYPMWDFSGYNSITTEPVKTPMKNYWDSSHFDERIGHLILKRIFRNDSGVPTDFGVLLRKENIDSELLKIRVQRSSYELSSPQRIDNLQKGFQRILGGEPLDQSIVENMFSN